MDRTLREAFLNPNRKNFNYNSIDTTENVSYEINNNLITKNFEINNTELAVQLKSGFKSYGKYNVLNNLNLNVPIGAIYGLLGPSGCGKTTILRTVVGRISLDSGIVNVLGKEPGSRGHKIPGSLVGYMPQEVALYNEFDINETLIYFGLLHNMPRKDTEARRDFLIEFLDLPPKEKLVKNLSGGQKRRVSMAIALLQEPKLLILDEPTVGVDPLLREKIWNHLIDISKTSKTTIIITTHYIEEARKADRIGLIRSGRILTENSPDYLLETYNESSLENVFLKLCIKDQDLSISTSKNINGFENPVYENANINSIVSASGSPQVIVRECKKNTFFTKFKKDVSKSFRVPKFKNFLGVLYKDSILIRRNLGFLSFQFLLPVIQISLFCLCIGREPYDLNFGIVNNETIYNSSENGASMYINELNNRTFKKHFSNWSEAYHLTKQGKLWGFIDLSENFTKETKSKFSTFSPNNGSNVNLYLDATNQQITFIVQARATEAYQSFLTKLLPFIPSSLLQSPVTIQNPLYGEKEPQFIDFMAPGIMATIIFTLTIGLTGLMFVIEKKEGLLDRSWVAGVNSIEILSAHIASKLIIMTVQIALLLVISIFVFEVNMKGPFIISAMLLLLQGFCGMSYGLAISSICNDETEVMQVTIGSVFPVMLLSGIIWPVEGMPNWVRIITNFSPLTHSAEALRSVASRGWGLGHYNVWLGTLTILAWSFFFDFIAVLFFNYDH
nr:ATP-binding cassette transporter Abch-like1 [Brachionus angularis]